MYWVISLQGVIVTYEKYIAAEISYLEGHESSSVLRNQTRLLSAGFLPASEKRKKTVHISFITHQLEPKTGLTFITHKNKQPFALGRTVATNTTVLVQVQNRQQFQSS